MPDIIKLQKSNLRDFMQNLFTHTITNYFIQNNEKDVEIKEMKTLLQNGFYFCINGDIIRSIQQQYHEKQSDDIFQWNSQISTFINDFNLDLKWITPIIQGYIQSFDFRVQNEQIKFIQISRRSKFQAGTRFNCRGIDDNGNVANFVETEQIIAFKQWIYSFISIRGSVPLFWIQDGVGQPIKITRALELTQSAFIQHFQSLYKTYGQIQCINLLGNKDQILNNGYKQLLDKTNLDYVKYEIFDFKNNKEKDFQKINNQIRNMIASQQNMEFFCYNKYENQIISKQKWVYRINCVDCLDRTNLYQNRLCFGHIYMILKQIGYVFDHQFYIDDSMMIYDSFNQNDEFLKSYKYLWSEHGDQLSLIYTGTNATTSQETKDGKQGFVSSLKHSISEFKRYYHSVTDDKKHLAVEQFLSGMRFKKKKSLIEQQLQINQTKYCTFEFLQVYSLTWNLKNAGPDQVSDEDFDKLFKMSFNLKQPDLIIIGLQEMVKLNTKNVVIQNNDTYERALKWDNFFISQCNRLLSNQYVLVQSKTLVGLHLIILISKSNANRISRIVTDDYKSGFKGILGNKGCVSASFFYDDSEIVVHNCHLASGIDQIAERKHDLENILQKQFKNLPIKNRVVNLDDLDYKILLGDLNMKIDLPKFMVINNIHDYNNSIDPKKVLNMLFQTKIIKKNEYLQILLDNDELNQLKWRQLEGFQEHAISFIPTYKFIVGSNKYVENNDQKIPSWCDRILISSQEGLMVQQQFYNWIDCQQSDHRPLVYIFSIEVKKINQEKFSVTRKSLLINLSQSNVLSSQSDQQSIHTLQNHEEKKSNKKNHSYLQ